jgi:hypothetical protein
MEQTLCRNAIDLGYNRNLCRERRTKMKWDKQIQELVGIAASAAGGCES